NINNKQNYFIAETCEYQNHFLSFCPKKIILTSVESDHQDFFPTYESICEAFISYICKLPKNGMLIYCADDSGAKEVASRAKKQREDIVLVPYGENALNSYKVNFKDIKEGKNTFEVSPLGNFFVSVPGKHIALDAVAAITLTTELLKEEGQNAKDYLFNIQEGLSSFQGGKRRSEVLGKVNVNKNSVIFIDDYAHHPTAIKKTLAGYREFYKGYKIILDFMSHTYTRTQALLEDFSKSFENADVLILHKIYASARENINEHKISGKTLFEKSKEHHNNVYYFEEVMDAKDFAIEEFSKKLESNYPNGILFVTMGAGDNWKLGQALYNELSR
ncbi:MAG: UDP-N-acetylmuramate--L-alanine ligase, partial [Treponema sp.]|nr:UDP-N-acetylmuramate--L-alanine ligase [Treponema sp.]